jgi:hypothetical protein
MIIDYSVARPPMSVLKAAGVTAVGRYIGYDGTPGHQNIHKNLTRAEAGHLLGAGIDIFLAFEYQPDAALHGRAQGVNDGRLATTQLAELGAPAGMAVYFALDFDIRDYAPASKDPHAKLGPAAAYFDGIRSTAPAYQVGVYGGYWAVSRCLDAGLASIAWQTVAWSGSPTSWDERAVLRQKLGTPLPGADLDTVREHTSHAHDYGQWPRPPLPKRKPPEYETHVTAGHMSAHDLAEQHGITFARMLRLTIDHFGSLRDHAPETYAWLNGCADPDSFANLKGVMPPGLTWRLPVNPS